MKNLLGDAYETYTHDIAKKMVKKGDYVGHPFRGNQWTKGRGSTKPSAQTGARSYKTKAGMVVDHLTPDKKDWKALLQAELDNDSAIASARAIFDTEIETPLGKVKAEVDQVLTDGELFATVNGVITDSSGQVVGNFSRIFDMSNKTVYNENLKLNVAFQGSGIGTTLLAHWEDQFARIGITKMNTLAFSTGSEVHPNNKMNGAYTWAKYGYKPTSQRSMDILFEDFETALTSGGKQYEAKWSAFQRIKKQLGLGDEAGGAEFSKALSKKYGKNILKVMSDLPEFQDFLKGNLTSPYVEGISWTGSKVPQIISKASETAEDVVNRWMRENPIGLENDDPKFWEDIRRVIGND